MPFKAIVLNLKSEQTIYSVVASSIETRGRYALLERVCNFHTIGQGKGVSNVPVVFYRRDSTRCPVKVNVPDTGASSTSGFAFRANVLPVVVPCTVPAFRSNFARVSLLVIEPGNVAVG